MGSLPGNSCAQAELQSAEENSTQPQCLPTVLSKLEEDAVNTHATTQSSCRDAILLTSLKILWVYEHRLHWGLTGTKSF